MTPTNAKQNSSITTLRTSRRVDDSSERHHVKRDHSTVSRACLRPRAMRRRAAFTFLHHARLSRCRFMSDASRVSLAPRRVHADDARERDKAYVDRRRVRAVGGFGGSGCVSFARDGGSRRRRGADGGDGGRGGDAVITACARTKGLGEIKNLLMGGRGKPGGSQGMIGSRGEDAIATVPLGTVVWRERFEDDGEHPDVVDTSNWGTSTPVAMNDDDGDGDGGASTSTRREGGWTRPRGLGRGAWEIVADLTAEGQTCVLAAGGRGGKGNRRMPVGKEAGTREPGEPGEEGSYVLELKSVADVGLIGLPNAGKSTLLRALSNATPRVGSYAFTTMQPQLGAIERSNGTSITVADIPGLIKGAHENRGLGHNFLRHIERCEAFAYIVDVSCGDSVKPWDALDVLRKELEEYLPGLSSRPAFVVATKTDLPNTSRALKTLRERAKPLRVYAVSALTRDGTDAVRAAIDEFGGDKDGWA